MLFPTVEYGLFFLIALVLAWGTVRHLQAHKLVLLVLSYGFYGFWDWHFVPLLALVSLIGWIAARGIQRGVRPRLWLTLGIVACLGLLGWYKYTAFLLQNLVELAAGLGLRLELKVQSPVLPLGISFMTFHAISLMMDTWRGKLRHKLELADVLLYVAFFPS
jgi:alginate O-acetyltransferase complex protein AlgI